MSELVFLGGTCGKNCWRDTLIATLAKQGVAAEVLFNPVVPHWTPALQEVEDRIKRTAPVVVYYLASPKDDNPNSVSAYSLVEATMALYDDPNRTVVVFDEDGLSGHALKVMKKVEKDLRARFPSASIVTAADLPAHLLERIRNAG